MVTMPREQYEGIQIKRANIGFYLQVVEVDVVGELRLFNWSGDLS